MVEGPPLALSSPLLRNRETILWQCFEQMVPKLGVVEICVDDSNLSLPKLFLFKCPIVSRTFSRLCKGVRCATRVERNSVRRNCFFRLLGSSCFARSTRERQTRGYRRSSWPCFHAEIVYGVSRRGQLQSIETRESTSCALSAPYLDARRRSSLAICSYAAVIYCMPLFRVCPMLRSRLWVVPNQPY